MPRQNRKQAYEDAKKQADAAGLCVADVVKVLAFDEAALTVDVQPITRYPDEDTFQTKPPVLAVPVATIYGGGFVIRPVYKAGDIGVVVYLDRDSDAVIAGGAEADPNTERLHSGDDAVFVGGIRTGGNSISGLPAGSLSLGTSDGGVYLSISPSGIDIKGNVTITGDLTVTGGVVNLNAGALETISVDENTAQAVRLTLEVYRGEFPFDPTHGTEYERIMGKKRSELEDDEIPEVIRDAVFQEPQVAEVSAVDYELVGRGLEVSVTGRLQSGNTITTEVSTA